MVHKGLNPYNMEAHLVDGVHFGHAGYLEMAQRWFDRITRH